VVLLKFVVDVMASLLEGIILLAVPALFSPRLRAVLTGAVGRLLEIDVDHVFPSQSAAAEEIRRETQNARFIWLLTGRGNELQRDTFSDLLKERPDKAARVFRIILPDPAPTSSIDWIAVREREIMAFDNSYTPGSLRRQIETNLETLRKPVITGCADVRVYSGPHLGRIVLTNHAAYFTPYRSNAHGRSTACIKYRAGGVMHDCFSRYFEQTWDSARRYF
jgi:hypothetical protein